MQEWRDFYAFSGTAAATLMGLMFVVVSLAGRVLATEEGARAARAFHAPSVVFFTTVIVVAMVMLIPHAVSAALGILLGVIATGGIIYLISTGVFTIWRTFELGFEDLMWYVALPYLSYATIGVAAVGIWKADPFGFYAAASAMVLLLLIGIRNAWDLVVYNIRRSSSQ
jgi:hypothetical protein